MQPSSVSGLQPKSRRDPPQPLAALSVPDALLRIDVVRAATGLSSSSLYRKLAAKQFPAPIRMGSRCTRWRAGDISAWLRAQVESLA